MEKGKAASERGQPALALDHYAQAATMAEDLKDDARFKQAWAAFCENEPRVPLKVWSTPRSGFAGVENDVEFSSDGSVMAGKDYSVATCVETATGRSLCKIHFRNFIAQHTFEQRRQAPAHFRLERRTAMGCVRRHADLRAQGNYGRRPCSGVLERRHEAARA